jgi:nicotinate-nucleotide adenylyltransferase
MARTIGLLTGTFDPVHLGHVELARAAMAAGELDEVWFLVNPASAHKANVLSYVHRFAMMEMAVRDEAGMRVVGGAEGALPHTMAGFRALMGRYPGERFVFIGGMDALDGLDRWDDVGAVVRGAAFLVARRAGSASVVDGLRARLGELGRELDVREFELARHGEASSKLVREAVRAGERPETLDPRVYAYIWAQGFYR